MKVPIIFFFLFYVFCVSVALAAAQVNTNQPFVAPSNDSGEETVREFEIIAADAKRTGERLFVIARRGKYERSRRISLARLAYAKAFLLEMRRFPFEAPVFAEGEPASGEGRIEFYLGSRLRLVTLAKLYKIPNLTCCPDYIPPAKKRKR